MSKGNAPSLYLYAVEETPKGKKNRWQEVGALWAHDDNKGFSVKLKYLPIAGQELVIREKLQPKDAQADAHTATSDSAEIEGGF
ncbi:MAG: hypothetical protein ABL897_12275 [Hyphomicrobium sp.]